MMIIEFLWYLESTVHDTNGWEISLALSLEERDTYSGARERVYLWVSSHCSCNAQIQAANLLRTAIYPS